MNFDSQCSCAAEVLVILLSLLSNLVLQKPCRRALAEGPSLPRALRAALPHLASSNVLVAEKAAVVIGNLCTDATLRKQVHMRDGYPAPVRLPCCCHPPLFFFFWLAGGKGGGGMLSGCLYVWILWRASYPDPRQKAPATTNLSRARGP